MNRLVVKCYARESTSTVEVGKSWHLPHHEVYQQSKPGKMHVAFGFSAELHGISTKALLSGPDMANQIVGVFAEV